MGIIERASQAGFSLVELSVAMAIFSMGLGSLSLMLLTAIHGTSQAQNESVASLQSASLAAMIAMSSDAYGHYVYPVETGADWCAEEVCPGDVLAAENLADWQSRLRNDLPGGEGLVCRDSTPEDGDSSDPSCDGSGTLVIKVFWTEPNHENPGDGDRRRMVSRLAW